MKHLKRTKIIATLGPAITGKIFSWDQYNDPSNSNKVAVALENIKELILKGVNVFRFNFSHGTHEEQLVRIKMVRDVASSLNVNIGLMLDTKGPEIRVGKLEDKAIEITAGDLIKIQTSNKDLMGNAQEFSVYASSDNYYMENDIQVGDPVYLDDGKLEVTTKEINYDEHYILAVAKNSHKLQSNKRINLPNAEYSMDFITDKEIEDIKFAADNDFDYIAASFVNTYENVLEIRELAERFNGHNIQIISKVETMQSIKNIDKIIEYSDGIMVARGDLGLEIPYYEVPYWEKYMIKYCRFTGKPVIIATQMLDSLETKLQPTRAEVTDVFFAVERGADCTMLSGETANGLYPVNAVDVMAKIDVQAEYLFDYKRSYEVYFPHTPFYKKEYGNSIISIAKKLSPVRDIENGEFNYDAVVYFGNNKNKIIALSNIRLSASIIVVTDDKKLRNYFGIYYGVIVKYVEDLNNYISRREEVITEIKEEFKFSKKILSLIDKN
ncbi:MAG: pyruvate kinase [Mycoplasmoidaceae bacterium]